MIGQLFLAFVKVSKLATFCVKNYEYQPV